MVTRQPRIESVSVYTEGRHRTLEGAIGALKSQPRVKVKLLVDDDGAFTAVLIDGQPNIISFPRRSERDRELCHRYVRTGLRSDGYDIYVLHEITGDDIHDILVALGRDRDQPQDPDWFADEFEKETAWLPGHRSGRRDHGYARSRYIPQR